MANPLVVGTPYGSHKRALIAFFDGCTNHWNHPLDDYLVFIKKAGNRLDPAKTNCKISGNIMSPESVVNKNISKWLNFPIC
jgi:hypothetical protein